MMSAQINMLLKQIADLRKAEAAEVKKESDLLSKIGRASEQARRTKSASTEQSKLKEVERATKDLAAVQKKRAEISTKIASKTKSLQTLEDRKARDDANARRKVADEQRRLLREQAELDRRLQTETLFPARLSGRENRRAPIPETNSYDFFISHASEDKDGFVRKLAESLRARGAKVWYDEFTLKVGDSLRRTIDKGLASSKFGVVVLSEHFFRKEWPNRELDGLVALETDGQTRILPIWHKVSRDEVAGFSAPLAGKVALNTSIKTVEEIADALCELLD
jgi:hypothetical protein